jgi:kumamolisin
MRLKIRFPNGCTGIVAFIFVLWISDAHAAGPAQQILGNSIRPVATAPATGAINPHRPVITRTTLQPNEAAAPMPFEVALKMRNFAELQARVNNGEHISPQEMADKYEPLPSDYQATIAWLTSKGLTITRQDSHHMAVFARGTVSQIQKAMQVTFARVASEGKEYTSAITAPSVPSTISPLLVGINGLQPHIRARHHLLHPDAANGAAPYTPGQIAQAYQATALYNKGLNGAGQAIAIVIDAFPSKDDLVEFWNAYGINQSINNIQFVPVPGVVDQSGSPDAASGEETLDTEWSSSIAPGAKVRVYNSTDLSNYNLDQAYIQIRDDANNHPEYGIHQMSMSYGLGEIETTYSQMDTDDQYFVELTNAGVTCFASTGDEGSTPGFDQSGNPNENGSLEPEAPASDPNVIAVGGTTLTLDTNNNESTETVWNNSTGASGGGTSGHFNRPNWQHGTGVPSGTMRVIPDISSSADPNEGADTVFQGSSSPSGGTSWSSPTCAAFCALINQTRANVGLSSVGQLGPYIYPLIGTSCFRDITSGNNATPNSGGLYAATTGYDEATGIGAPIVSNLAISIAQTASLVGVYPQSTLQTVNQGLNATFAVTASGSLVSYQWQRMPVGTTTWSNLSDNATYSGSATASLTVTSTTPAMSGDQFQCVVTYSGTPTLTSNPPSVLMVETPWVVGTLAGKVGISGLINSSGVSAEFNYPTGIALDPSGNLYVSDLYNNVIREVTPGGAVTTPYGSTTGVQGSADGANNSARFYYPRDLTGYTSGGKFYLYMSDEGNNAIRKIDTSTGQVSTLSTGSPALSDPKGIGVDSSGNIFVADTGNNVIRKITQAGAVSTFAGSSSFTAGFADGAGTTQALFNQPIGLAVDGSNNVYITDFGNAAIRKITSLGAVSTLAGPLPGTAAAGVTGCLDGTGAQALFNVPRGITTDSSGNLYVTDSYTPIVTQSAPTFSGNDILRKITSAGVVTTLAGQAGVAGTSSGTGTGAQFYNPAGLVMNSSGTIYIADASNNMIRSATVLPIPTVSLTTTQANASVQTGATGQFTVTRTGSSAASLTVNYSLAGTAVNGTDYETLSGTVTIPSGASSATITVTPFLDPSEQPSVTVQISLTNPAGTIAIDPNANSGTVTIAELPSSDLVTLSQWESHYSGIAPLDDGLPVLLKYLCDIDPSVTVSTADAAALPTPAALTINGSEYLTLTFRRYLYATGITVNAEISSDLKTWTFVNLNPPDPANAFSHQIGTAPDGNPIWQVGIKSNGNAEQFIRLNITSP